jgi:hypothetical protein
MRSAAAGAETNAAAAELCLAIEPSENGMITGFGYWQQW